MADLTGGARIGEGKGGIAKVLSVAWREFTYTALTKAFLFGAVIVPLLMFALVGAMPLLMNRETPPLTGTFAIVDSSGLVAAEAEKEFGRLRAESEGKAASVIGKAADAQRIAKGVASGEIRPDEAMAELDAPNTIDIGVRVERDEAVADALRAEVRDGKLLGLAVVDQKLLTPEGVGGSLELLVPTGSSPKHTVIYERVLRDATVRARVAANGGDYAELSKLLRRPSIGTQRMSKEGATAKESVEARLAIPIGFMMLLWISTFTSGNYLLTTTIEEKSNKVMEVLLSAVSPMQLLTGKILGQAIVSVVMLVMYGGLAMAALSVFAMLDLVPMSLLVYLVLYFTMAYFMVATIMASVGSAVSDLREAQALIGPAMLVMMVPLMLWFPISDNPNGLLATITSFIPPLIPFVMILRVSAATEPVAFWQIAASLVVGFSAMLVMMWMGSRIFRVGVLMQGKPPSPLELLKWVRYQ